jgi:DNA-binding response OmpR family regulator
MKKIKKILIIDDDEAILDAVKLMLEDSGYKVDAEIKGSRIQKRVISFEPDLILLDVLMSGLDGRDICKKIKNDPETNDIPVIMISAHPGAKESLKECGADGYLAKPFQFEDLLKIIKKNIK